MTFFSRFRTVPAALVAALLLAGILLTGGRANAGEELPFKERLTLVSVSDTGVATYVGKSTQLGQVTVYWDVNPDSDSFLEWEKIVASGDKLYGIAIPDETGTSGTDYIWGGTGRLEGATGVADFEVLEFDPDTGLPAVGVIEGYISLADPDN